MALSYPYPGCVVEYLEANAPQIAFVMEDSGGKLRLLLPGRKEVKLAANRLLPWIGPAYSASAGKEDAVRILEQHKTAREAKAGQIEVMDLWEMAQGEISQASAQWFAELVESAPTEDDIAAYGRSLLNCKTHFRFQPPEFQIYDAETVEKRLAEQRAREEKEALASQGTAFMHLLWDVATRKRQFPGAEAIPPDPLPERIKKMLLARVANPESQEDDALWRMLSKGLPDVPLLPLQLLMAWGVLPRHYNFWLDRADYDTGDDWWLTYNDEVQALAQFGKNPPEELPVCELPFISIDGPTTFDIDDAFYIESAANGWQVTMAFAAPALAWQFGAQLDKIVSRRATSIYLPEGDLHMLPECLGTDAFSLNAGERRPALCMRFEIASDGQILSFEPFVANVKIVANLRYPDCQAIMDAAGAVENNPANPFAKQILLVHDLADRREKLRIANGAIIMERENQEIILEEAGEDVNVLIKPETPARDAQKAVSELMIIANGAVAEWAQKYAIPLLHRTQNVTLPKEYAGVWSKPEDLATIMRSLIPSTLEIQGRPHAALGLSRYAQVTSPLRRYSDLLNEAQTIHYLQHTEPRWDEAALGILLDIVAPALDAGAHIQRNRPRYWKLLHIKQQGEKVWWAGVITDDNENFVNVAIPSVGISVRGRRTLFYERVTPGMSVQLRLGKVNPLANEIQILEVMPEE